ncbi:MAG TPA: VOC family protein [Candidatus Paceibacterota bacterium]|nr:VOC family protein [Candidatus Paceibacterota bacterium]HMO83266.1 VOC family protein [Candidatus Paceibacterota bacterium]
MAQVSVYLNFSNNTEEAFNFYQSVFGGEFVGGISRMGDAPVAEGQPALPEAEKNLVMHVCLPIFNGFQLMGSDVPASLGMPPVSFGNNVYINLQPDTKEEGDRLFNTLSEGGVVEMPMQDMFWGDYFGSFADKFGVRWMIAVSMVNHN